MCLSLAQELPSAVISPEGAHAWCHHIPSAQLQQVASYLIRRVGKAAIYSESIAQVPDDGREEK